MSFYQVVKSELWGYAVKKDNQIVHQDCWANCVDYILTSGQDEDSCQVGIYPAISVGQLRREIIEHAFACGFLVNDKGVIVGHQHNHSLKS